MWFIGHKKKIDQLIQKEAEIQAVRYDTLKTIDNAKESTQKLNSILSDDSVTSNIFMATGGDRRL